MEIKLTQGKSTIIDDEDFERVSKHKWHITAYGYAKTNKVWLHRLIINCPKGKFVDHINRDKLDNRKENLRICTYQNNLRNQNKRKACSSGFKGVSWDKQMKQWRVDITLNYKKIFIGLFKQENHAAMAYDINAKVLFGEFVKTNF